MSSDDSDTFLTDEESTTGIIGNGIQKCLAKKPLYNVSQKSKNKSLRAQINKLKGPTSKERHSTRIDNKKQFEDYFRELSSDFSNLSKKMDTLCDCISNIFDRLDHLENRMESFITQPPPPQSFSSVAAQAPDNDRLAKLEYMASEEERKKRQLEVSLTHPNIDPNNSDLLVHVRSFLSTTLRMENREIDSNFQVRKLQRNNTVMLTFSDRKFKRFIFTAKKRLRAANQEQSRNLFINDNLTSLNYSLLKKLKIEKARRIQNVLPSFDSVYSFEGKVFAKKCKEDASSAAICISSNAILEQFLSTLEESLPVSANSQ